MATVSYSADGASHVELPLRQFDADEYIAMAEAGVFEQRRRVELIGGYVVDMSPAGPERNYVVQRFSELFAGLRGTFKHWTQGTLLVDGCHVFDPDFMLLKPRKQSYKDALPTPADVALVVEVAASSLGRDERVKLPDLCLARNRGVLDCRYRSRNARRPSATAREDIRGSQPVLRRCQHSSLGSAARSRRCPRHLQLSRQACECRA